MVSISQFFYELRKMVPGVMNEIMEGAVLRSARKFCSDTNFLILNETVSSVEKDQAFDIADLWAASGKEVDGMVFANIVRITGDGDKIFESLDYSIPTSGTVIIQEPYDELSIIASIKPGNEVLTLPEILYSDCSEVICHGAASYLYSLPESLNGNLHQYHEREYVEKMRDVHRWRLESLPHQSFSSRIRSRSFF